VDTLDIANIYCSHKLNTARKLEPNIDSNSHCVNESLQFAMLNYIDVDVNGLQLPVNALIDGGSQVCVVNSKLIESRDLICVGNVLITGITGSPINYSLYTSHIALTTRDADRCNDEFITIVCTACDDLNEQLVVDHVYANMQSVNVTNVVMFMTLRVKMIE